MSLQGAHRSELWHGGTSKGVAHYAEVDMRDTIVVTALLGFLVGCSPEVDENIFVSSVGQGFSLGEPVPVDEWRP